MVVQSTLGPRSLPPRRFYHKPFILELRQFPRLSNYFTSPHAVPWDVRPQIDLGHAAIQLLRPVFRQRTVRAYRNLRGAQFPLLCGQVANDRQVLQLQTEILSSIPTAG